MFSFMIHIHQKVNPPFDGYVKADNKERSEGNPNRIRMQWSFHSDL